ncbi:unnamed protein product [Musa acuminata var. zebrina]
MGCHNYHEHELKPDNMRRPYRCDGCEEMGFGPRYACAEHCGYLLHEHCANTRDTLAHPFFPGCVFHFLRSGDPNRRCDACGGDINGFVYHCFDRGWDLHPCCANLETMIHVQAEEENNMTLFLHEKETSKCCRCGKKKLNKRARSWMYVSGCKEYHFHVSCVKKDMIEHLENSFLGGKGAAAIGEVNESRDLEIKSLPGLQLARRRESGKKGRFAKFKKIVQIAISFIMAAFVGDPSAFVASLIVNFITNL